MFKSYPRSVKPSQAIVTSPTQLQTHLMHWRTAASCKQWCQTHHPESLGTTKCLVELMWGTGPPLGLAPSHPPWQWSGTVPLLTSLCSPHCRGLGCGRSSCTWLHQRMASPLASSASQPWKKQQCHKQDTPFKTPLKEKWHSGTSVLVCVIEAGTEDVSYSSPSLP